MKRASTRASRQVASPAGRGLRSFKRRADRFDHAGRAARVAMAMAMGAPILATAALVSPPSVSAAPRTAAASTTVVGAAEEGSSGAYWTVSAAGAVYAHNGAKTHGSLAGRALSAPIVAMASTSNGGGYWLVSSSGQVYSFGNAPNHGSLKAATMSIVGMAATSNNGGYWLVSSTGTVYRFGNAPGHGSVSHPAKPIVGMAATSNNGGYWLVSSTGTVYSFGNAHNYGSAKGASIVAIASLKNNHGYWLLSKTGGVYALGSAANKGSASAYDKATGATSVAILPYGSGYRIPTSSNGTASVGISTTTSRPVEAVTASPSKITPKVIDTQNPSHSVAPSSAFEQACFAGQPNVSACNSAALASIDSARAGEGLGALALPGDFSSLSTVDQLITVANAERTSRGLPTLPENSSIDRMAQSGAVAGEDPTGPSGYGWGSNISWGYPTALSADFAWMYDDGIGSDNIGCTSTNHSSCWGHRENILSPWAGKSGAGVYVDNGDVQLTELFVENY